MSTDSEKNQPEEFIDIPVDRMKNGLHFPDEKVATLSVEKWCEKLFCPLSRVRYTKHDIGDNGKVKYGQDSPCEIWSL